MIQKLPVLSRGNKALFTALLALILGCSGSPKSNDSPKPVSVSEPVSRQVLIAKPGTPQFESFRRDNCSIGTSTPPSNDPNSFTGKLIYPPAFWGVQMGHVQLQSLMNYLTFAGGDVGANLVTGSVDKPYADYVLRNCSKPTDPKLLDPFGSPVYDSLKVADGFAAEEPYVNQLRFLLTAPANLKNEKMQLELLNPQINEGVTLTQTPFNNAVLSGRYLHSKTDYLNFTPVPSSYEVFAGWLLEDLQWEQISPTEIQAKVVINVPYIPGYMDSSGNPITRKIYARVVPQASSSAWISSNTLGIGIVHKDYCADEYALVEKVKQQQAAEGVLFDLITHYNISHPPYSAEVVGYEPPVIATGIAQCTAGDYGRFVHVKLGCAKEFGPYKGKGSVPDTSFAFYTGDMVYTFNNPKGSSTGSTLSALSSKYPKS